MKGFSSVDGKHRPEMPDVPVSVSVVMPVHNSSATLARVLPSLAAVPAEWEIILVDDGSTDDSAKRAQELLPRARLLRLAEGRGAAGARNAGVEISTGEMLIFVDSDVAVEASTLLALAGRVGGQSAPDAVFGAYSPLGFPGEPPVSRFRNALHSFMHHRHAGPAFTFWTGLGAVSRRAFLQAGGFRPSMACIEDVEFGWRLHLLGYRIELDPSIQGTHWKCWTLSSMVVTDIWKRAAVWTEAGFRGEVPLNRLNTKWTEKLALLFLAVIGFSLAIGQLHYAARAFLAYGLTQLSFLRFLHAHGGSRAAVAGLVLLPVYHFCCGFGFLLGALRYVRSR